MLLSSRPAQRKSFAEDRRKRVGYARSGSGGGGNGFGSDGTNTASRASESRSDLIANSAVNVAPTRVSQVSTLRYCV